MNVLDTARLRLEPFAPHHLDGLHEMNRLPEVARFLGGTPETPEQTAAAIARVQRCWAAWGTSWWAFVQRDEGGVIGAGCIQYLRREAAPPEDPLTLCGNPLEIGWRLHPRCWHLGYASEAASRMTAFAFERFPIAELLAVCHPDNRASARVMERLGMRYRGLEPWYGTQLSTYALARSAAGR